MTDTNYAKLQAALIHQRLVGGVIEQAVVGEGWDGESAFGFDVRLPSGKLISVWVTSDPEGNGPGFLEIGTP